MNQISSLCGKHCWTLTMLIVVASTLQLIRIISVTAPHGDTPFLSANDRSRWSTIAALCEDRSFVIDRFLDKRDHTGKQRTWYSIDMVRREDGSGEERYYSSKPPFLSVLYAGITSPVSSLWNKRLSDAPLEVGRTVLALGQLIPMIFLWCAMLFSLSRRTVNEFALIVAALFFLFGTFLSTYINSLNNHLPAAIAAGLSLLCLAEVLTPNLKRSRVSNTLYAFLLGFLCAFAGACDLPAFSWLAAVVLLVVIYRGWMSATLVVAGSLPIVFFFFVTSWIANGDVIPAYGHRDSLGVRIGWLDAAADTAPASMREASEAALRNAEKLDYHVTSIEPARRAATWQVTADVNDGSSSRSKRFALAFDEHAQRFALFRWNDWYDYPRSYWLEGNMKGIDLGEPSRLAYLFHITFGHHGFLSLTPLLLIGLIGLLWPKDKYDNYSVDETVRLDVVAVDAPWRAIGIAVLIVTLIQITFYTSRPLHDRNYGGVASGFRWMLWVIPLWFYFLPSGIQRISSTAVGKLFVIFLLGIGVFTANLPWDNPWQVPFLYAWLH